MRLRLGALERRTHLVARLQRCRQTPVRRYLHHSCPQLFPFALALLSGGGGMRSQDVP